MSRTSAGFKATQGLNRVSTAIKGATSSFSSTFPAEGDITKGSVLEVELPGSTNTPEVYDVGRRLTGAALISVDTQVGTDPPTGNNPGEYAWAIRVTAGTAKLYVWGHSTGPAATLKFWVF